MNCLKIIPQLLVTAVTISVCVTQAHSQTDQKGADRKAKTWEKLRIEYVGYRPVQYEDELVHEPQNERPNRGGLVYLYFTNISEEPVRLAFWRVNGKDESYWRLGGRLAWDRDYGKHIAPGEPGVLEIDAITDDFADGQPFSFQWIARPSWRPVVRYKTQLREDPVQISFIRFLSGLRTVEVHIRNQGTEKVTLDSPGVAGHEVSSVNWTSNDAAPATQVIARMRLTEPLETSELTVIKVRVRAGGDEPRWVYAHRRAFADYFPVGCWTNNEKTWPVLDNIHIDTFVRGGEPDDEFYSEIAPEYGFKTMVPAGIPVSVDRVRALSGHEHVACWMLDDEPDWKTPANIMLFLDRNVRSYDKTKPTFLTLCRNVKFFEYAPIADIPCMDHYSVTAPSSSHWPKFYGTHLEETAYYTRDLKYASEPKPVWIWSQGIADWGERPKRPVPTPEELAAQLVLNLSRGAKGILWFNYDHDVAERYPDVRDAMRQWSRVLHIAKQDLLGSEPSELEVETPDKVDAVPLLGWETIVVCSTNLDYEIDPEAYPFKTRKDLEIVIDTPDWIRPRAVFEVSPDGVSELEFSPSNNRMEVHLPELHAATLIVIASKEATKNAYETKYTNLIMDEM